MNGKDYVQQVAANVRAEASRRGFSQAEFADELGMHRATMSTKWRGSSAWRLDELPKVALLFGLPSPSVLTRSKDDADLDAR